MLNGKGTKNGSDGTLGQDRGAGPIAGSGCGSEGRAGRAGVGAGAGAGAGTGGDVQHKREQPATLVHVTSEAPLTSTPPSNAWRHPTTLQNSKHFIGTCKLEKDKGTKNTHNINCQATHTHTNTQLVKKQNIKQHTGTQHFSLQKASPSRSTLQGCNLLAGFTSKPLGQ